MMELEQKSHKSGTWVAQKRLQLPVTERVNVLPEVIDCTRCRKQGCAGRCIGQWFRGVGWGLGLEVTQMPQQVPVPQSQAGHRPENRAGLGSMSLSDASKL